MSPKQQLEEEKHHSEVSDDEKESVDSPGSSQITPSLHSENGEKPKSIEPKIGSQEEQPKTPQMQKKEVDVSFNEPLNKKEESRKDEEEEEVSQSKSSLSKEEVQSKKEDQSKEEVQSKEEDQSKEWPECQNGRDSSDER